MVESGAKVGSAGVSEGKLMFRGEYSHSIDAKGRVIIPAKFREELGEDLVVTKEIGGCLSVYSMNRWVAFEEKLSQLPRSKADVVRFFSGSAVDTGIDKQGRVQLSQALRDYSHLEKDVVLIGMQDRVEIWNKAKWEENNAKVEQTIQLDVDDLDF